MNSQEPLRSNRLIDWVELVGLTLFLLALDQGSKWLVRQNLAVGESWVPIPALAKVFAFTHVQNTGVAFGQLAGLGWLFMLVNFTIAIGIVFYYAHIPRAQWPLRLAAAFILVGSLGNVIDRLRTALLLAPEVGGIWQALPLASVTDFVDFRIWPVWNIADLCVVTGVTIVAITLWREEQAEMASETVTEDG
jgi:signal peptidase II